MNATCTTPASQQSPSFADGRDDSGRFARGNPGGPGNPFAGRVAQLRRMLLTVVTVEEIEAIFAKLVEIAKEGHFGAMKLVLSYTLGKPGVGPDPAQYFEEWAMPSRSQSNAASAAPTEAGCRAELSSVAPTKAPSAALPESALDLSEELDELLRTRDKNSVDRMLGKAAFGRSAPSTNGLFSNAASEVRIVAEKPPVVHEKPGTAAPLPAQKKKK